MAEGEADADTPASRGTDLSAVERTVLAALQVATAPVQETELLSELGLPPEAVRGSLQRLRSKALARVEERVGATPRLSARGERALRDGLPERRALRELLRPRAEPAPGSSLGELTDEERSAAVGVLRRRGYLAGGFPFSLRADAPDPERALPEEEALSAVASGALPSEEKMLSALERRGLVVIERTRDKRWSASPEGRRLDLRGVDAGALGALTPELLASGGWRQRSFRPYDVRAPVPLLSGPRPHPYVAWREEFEEILLGLGFEQAEGPLLETEFWNADALFMPQDHPARSIHDVLFVEGLAGRPPPAPLLASVAAAHLGRPLRGERRPLSAGWTDRYDAARAARPVLRSQTTAVSARYLARHPTAPFRMYSIGRNFRAEALDARHLVEFEQCEGILGEEGTSLRELIGTFHALAEAIGIRELKIRPSYFPFTEPSIEGYVRHPRLGWMEVFPGGLMRPEVLRPLGIDVPVAAWGIGIARLAMVALGINDIRELFQDDLAALHGLEG